ncbi:hypothetical protein L2D14_10515 [Thalassospiraceae bacterium LMO-JJ14]|nr:hypothetical protein L2D14_10515 [Thalassospiraceae bacterium LMO-JJ14]
MEMKKSVRYVSALPFLLLTLLSGCVAGGYQFLHYENVNSSEYRLDRMAFKQTGDSVSGEEICAIEVYSKFYNREGKLAGCGYLVDKCSGWTSSELTEKWFASATLLLDGKEISNSGFFSLNDVGPNKGQATCVITEKPWQSNYHNQQPVFRGQDVSVAY